MSNTKNISSTSTRPVGNIPQEDISNTATYLNTLLADEYGLFTKTLNYHWNITGPRFHSLHEFLEGHYNTILGFMDDIAERVRVLGETPLSTVKDMNDHLNLKEVTGNKMSDTEMLEDLYKAHMYIHENMREFIGEMPAAKDPATEDFLVGLLKEHQMMAWMIRSHIV